MFTLDEKLKEAGLSPVNTEIPPETEINQPNVIEGWKETWSVKTLVDAFKERPPIQYVAEGIFKYPSLNMIYGYPASLKTLLLQDLSICVAAGIDWLPPLPIDTNNVKPIKVKQSPVIWLDFDCGEDTTLEHMEALARARGLNPENIPYYSFSFPEEGFNPKNKWQLGEMIKRCIYYEAKMISIDNLGNISGGVDENSNQMVPIMSGLRKLSEYTGSAVNTIHHQTKSDGVGRKGNRLRGHSSIEASLDLALLISRDANSEKITIESTKSRRNPIDPFSALFTFSQKENMDLKEARFFGLGIDMDTATISIRTEIKNVLSDDEMNKGSLAEKVSTLLPKVGINRIRDEIDIMGRIGEIKIEPGFKGSKICKLS